MNSIFQNNPTTEYAIKLFNSSLNSNRSFFGSTNEECRKMFWASLLTLPNLGLNDSTIRLNQEPEDNMYRFLDHVSEQKTIKGDCLEVLENKKLIEIF